MGAGVWFQDEARSHFASAMGMSATDTLRRGGAQSSLLSRNSLIGVQLLRLAGGHLRGGILGNLASLVLGNTWLRPC